MDFDNVLGNILSEEIDRRANWWVIAQQLVKINVVVDESTLDLLGEGHIESVLVYIKKLERFVQIVCGEDILDQLGMFVFNQFEATPEPSETGDQDEELIDQPQVIDQVKDDLSSVGQNEIVQEIPVETLISVVMPVEVASNKSIGPVDEFDRQFDPAEIQATITAIQAQHPAQIEITLPSITVQPIVEYLPSQQKEQEQDEQLLQYEEEPEPLALLLKKHRAAKKVKPAVDLSSIDMALPLPHIENSLELLLSTLSRHLSLKPLTAAGLLTNHNFYLRQACQLGVKQSFDPVINWYTQLIDNVEVIAELLTDEWNEFGNKKQFSEVVKSIASGLASLNQQVVQLSYTLLGLLFQEIQNVDLLFLLKLLFQSTETGSILNLSLEAIRQYPAIACEMLQKIIQNAKLSVSQVIRYDLLANSKVGYIGVCLEFLHQTQVPQDLLLLWCDFAMKNSTLLLTEIWIAHTEFVDSQPEMASVILNMLRNELKDSRRIIRTQAVFQAFKLLEHLASLNNSSAPILYRQLVFSVIETIHDHQLRSEYWQMFKNIFNSYQMPYDLLIDSLSRQPYKLYEFDFEFYNFLAQKQPISIMQFWQEQLQHYQWYGKVIVDQYCDVVNKFDVTHQAREWQEEIAAQLKGKFKGTKLHKKLLKYAAAMLVKTKVGEMVLQVAEEAPTQQETALQLYHQNISTGTVFRFQATSVINKIQLTLKEKQFKQQQQQQLEKDRIERQKQNVRKQVERRRLELGVPNSTESQAKIQSFVPVVLNQKVVRNFVWFDMKKDLEDQDVATINHELHSLKKYIAQLFNKYANKGMYRPKTQDFEADETITLAEVIKTLKDVSVLKMTKEDLCQCFKLVAHKLDAQSFTQPQFTQFIVQLALNLWKEGRPTLKIILSAPNAQQDSADVLEIQSRLDQDPKYPLPIGYTKSKQSKERLQYQLQDDLQAFIGRARLIIIPIIDDLISSLFQVHFLEPHVIQQDYYKVKPVLIKPVVQPKEINVNHVVETIRQFGTGGKPRTWLTPIAKVPYSPTLKQLVNQQQDREICDEVAQTMELMLQAVERGKTDIYDIKPKQIVNQHILEIKRQNLAQQFQGAQSERKRIQRAEMLKEQIKQAQIEKLKFAQKVQKPMTDRELAAKRANEKYSPPVTLPPVQTPPTKLPKPASPSKLSKPAFKKMPKPIKRSVSEPKSPKTPQKLVKKAAVETLAQIKEAKQMVVNKEIEAKQKEQQFKLAIRRKTENQLKLGLEQRNKEQKFDLEVIEFLDQENVKRVFQNYDKCLLGFYQFYSSQGKVEVGYDLQFRMENMHFREFLKFGYQSQLTPVLIPQDQLMQIFRAIARLQQEGLSSNAVQFISYESFKKALVTICIYAHDKLDGTAQTKESKLREVVKLKEGRRKEVTEQVRAAMKQEFESKVVKSNDLLGRKEDLDKVRERLELDFLKFLKQQEAQGSGLKHRVDVQLGIAQEIDPKLLNLRQKYETLQTVSTVADNLVKDDLRDNIAIKPAYDVSLISEHTVEELFKFLELQSGDISQKEIDAQLKSLSQGKVKAKKIVAPELPDTRQKSNSQQYDQNSPIQEPLVQPSPIKTRPVVIPPTQEISPVKPPAVKVSQGPRGPTGDYDR